MSCTRRLRQLLPGGFRRPVAAPRTGRRAPELRLATVDGAPALRLANLRAAGLPVLLVFADVLSSDGFALLRDAAGWQRGHADELTVAAVCGGDLGLLDALTGSLQLTTLLHDADGTAAHAYGIHGAAGGALVDARGLLLAPVATSPEAVELLVDVALGRPLHVPRWLATLPVVGPALGTPVPAAILRDAGGALLPLRDALAGEPSVLLLWDGGCPRCDAIRGRLAAWPEDSPRLLAVASAPDDRLGAPLLLDPGGAVAAALGCAAPAAVLLDRDGLVAAPLAHGGEAILTLARPAVHG